MRIFLFSVLAFTLTGPLANNLAHADPGVPMAPKLREAAQAGSAKFQSKLAGELRKIGEHGRYGRRLTSKLPGHEYEQLSVTLDGRLSSRDVRSIRGASSYVVERQRGDDGTHRVFRKVQPLAGHAEGDALESVRLTRTEGSLFDPKTTRDVSKVYLVKDGKRVRRLTRNEIEDMHEIDRNALFSGGVNVGYRRR